MNIAIIIPTYNRPLLLERTLRSLAACQLPKGAHFYIIENGPRSGAEEVYKRSSIREFASYSHLPIAERSAALNYAIRSTDAEFLVFFDDDITVARETLTAYVEAARRYGPGHFFGGPLVADAEVQCPPHLFPYLPPSAKGRSLSERETRIDSTRFDYFFGANWAVFRSDLLTAGLFSEELGASSAKNAFLGEDNDIQQRLIAASVKAVYLSRAVIYHFIGKECYTREWIWHRQFRTGMTAQKLNRSKRRQIRIFCSAILWPIKFLISQIFFLSIEKRTQIQMQGAYLAGWLYGIWPRARHNARNRQSRQQGLPSKEARLHEKGTVGRAEEAPRWLRADGEPP